MSHESQIVRVDLGKRSYEIIIGAGLLNRTAELLQPLALGRAGIIITDTNVEPLYARELHNNLADDGFKISVLPIPSGETSKSLEQMGKLLNELTSLELDRQSFVIALGGGVVGDLAGFISAIYLRGITYIQIPTSLLALVDSSVGGKVGINLPAGKNLVGAFHQPKLVIADINTLNSLPARELRSGFAEVIKYGAIRDAKFFTWLEANVESVFRLDTSVVNEMVRRCCEIKANIVNEDERESGVRAILNFGHTIGHALESLTGYKELLHGEAISIGMCYATWLSSKRAGLSEKNASRVQNLIKASGLPTQLSRKVDWSHLLQAMRLDKKTQAGILRFVLLENLGKAILSESVSYEDIQEVMDVSCG